MLNRSPSLRRLEEDERRARARLALHRAKLYRGRTLSPMESQRREQELERALQIAIDQIRRAKTAAR